MLVPGKYAKQDQDDAKNKYDVRFNLKSYKKLQKKESKE